MQRKDAGPYPAPSITLGLFTTKEWSRFDHDNTSQRVRACCDARGPPVPEWLGCLPTAQGESGSIPGRALRIFAGGNRAGRCRWSAGFLGDLPSPLPLHPSADPSSTRFTHIGSQDLVVNVEVKQLPMEHCTRLHNAKYLRGKGCARLDMKVSRGRRGEMRMSGRLQVQTRGCSRVDNPPPSLWPHTTFPAHTPRPGGSQQIESGGRLITSQQSSLRSHAPERWPRRKAVPPRRICADTSPHPPTTLTRHGSQFYYEFSNEYKNTIERAEPLEKFFAFYLEFGGSCVIDSLSLFANAPRKTANDGEKVVPRLNSELKVVAGLILALNQEICSWTQAAAAGRDCVLRDVRPRAVARAGGMLRAADALDPVFVELISPSLRGGWHSQPSPTTTSFLQGPTHPQPSNPIIVIVPPTMLALKVTVRWPHPRIQRDMMKHFGIVTRALCADWRNKDMAELRATPRGQVQKMKSEYNPFAVILLFSEALLKLYFQNIPPLHLNKAKPSLGNYTKRTAHRIHAHAV
ncbi:hypothetical protein PR048_019161 [Dryococelus australis]|uniref:Uncharacterized protein n=1 Tax=Dryococelus australis TaxID=614101 RepID=A0ABQ9H2Q2_9NEOP|nr:hypothetical protein PR048_019161 [Dryococelus australis]